MEHVTSDKWLGLTKNYQRTVDFKSWVQVVNSFIPFFILWAAAYYAFSISVWLMLPLAFAAACFVLRIFIIQHDCGHGSFFKKRSHRDLVGRACSLFTITPYRRWQWEHAMHHAHSGNVDHRDLGEVITLTAKEFLALSKWGKLKYRAYRHPFVTFIIGPAFMFFISNRIMWHHYKGNKMVRNSIWSMNVVLALFFVAGYLLLGWQFLVLHTLIIYLAAAMGVWMFYVQHQFEDGYWQPTDNWDRAKAAVHGSSYFKLPRILQWVTGNIGFHHIHHLNPLIPNYELEKCHNDNEVFQKEVTTLTLANCWETMKLKFWDEDLEKMIGWKEMKALYLK